MTAPQEAMRRVFRIEKEHLDGQPPLRAILRDQLAPILRLSPAGERELVQMRWGFPAPPGIGARPIANVGNARNSSWRPWLSKEFRCLVPATSFCYYGDQPKNSALVRHRSEASALRPGGALAPLDRQTENETRSIGCSASS